MKTKFLFLSFLFSTVFCFGQKAEWSAWKSFPCYKGIYFSVANFGKHNGNYLWGLRFQNTYNYPIAFDYEPVVGGESYGVLRTITIASGKTWSNESSLMTALLFKNSSTDMQVRITKVCFSIEGYDCYKDGYAQCDNGTPIIPNKSTTNQNNFSNNNQNTKTQQNNTYSGNTSYQNLNNLINKKNNLCQEVSKALLASGNANPTRYNQLCYGKTFTENDIALLQSEITQLESYLNSLKSGNNSTYQQNNTYQQQQNYQQQQQIAQQNANKKQQYINTFNEGVKLGNTGNYSAAAQKYKEAINYATNETEKQQAQNAYNKLSKANTQQQAINQFSNSIADLALAIQQQKEAKKAQEEAKKIQEEIAAQQKKYQQELEDKQLNSDWENAIQLQKNDNYESYIKAINIMLPYANANKINAMALNNLGFWYWKVNDYTNAMKWYQAAANGGDANGMFNLGILHQNGQGTTKDIEKAKAWYLKACEKGYDLACKQEIIKEQLAIQAKIAKLQLRPQVIFETVDKKTTAKSIIDKYITAIGGKDKLLSVKSITIADEEQGVAKLYKSVISNGKRIDLTIIPEGIADTFKTAFNGITAYTQYNSGKKIYGEENTILLQYKTQIFPELELSKYKNIKIDIEKINGKKCFTIKYEIKLSSTSSMSYKCYYDIESGLLIAKKEGAWFSSGFTFFDDYREVNGIYFPFKKIIYSFDGKNYKELITTEIKINDASIIDADFE